MSRRTKSQSTSKPETVTPVPATGIVVPSRAKYRSTATAFVLGIAVAALVGAALWPYEAVAKRLPAPQSVKSDSAPAAKPTITEPELWRVAAMTDEELAAVDIAYINLLCATGLPGSESLNIPQCRQTLDQWAALVQRQTEKYLYKFQQNPKEYEGKEGYFRMLMLVTVLQQDLGVHYNMDRVREVDFKRSQDLFIHGMINNKNGGTCTSMPVLYTAVARRLGYPVRLVLAKAHVLCRWDDGTVRFNIEGSGVGMNSHPDKHYLTWPYPITAPEIERGEYLRSLTPREELALFLAGRGHCLDENGQEAEAYVAYAHAHELAPKQPENLVFLRRALRETIDLQALARQKGEAGRERSASLFDDVMLQNRLNQEQMERQFRQEQEFSRQNEAYQRNLNGSLLPHATTNTQPLFPVSIFPSPN